MSIPFFFVAKRFKYSVDTVIMIYWRLERTAGTVFLECDITILQPKSDLRVHGQTTRKGEELMPDPVLENEEL
jgi:hypothetical protein